MFDRFLTGEFYQSLCSNDFNRGYLAGVCLVLGLLIFFVIVRLVLKIIFRRHRCSQIVVPALSGDLTVSRAVIEGTARQVLCEVRELEIRRIRLYRQGQDYSLLLCCTFFDGGRGIPEIAEKIRTEIRKALEKQFGITTLQRIDFRVEERGDAAPQAEIRPPSAGEDEEFHADSGV